MTRKRWLVVLPGLFLLAFVFPLVPILLWMVLAASAWYIKQIPEKKLPLATFLATHQPTFYNWLSGFLSDWQKWPMIIFFAVLALGVLIWIVFTLRLIPLPIYGASIEIKDSAEAVVDTYTTMGNEPYCFNNLPLGRYTISQVDPPGFASSTQNVVTATIQPDSITLVEFGDSRVSVPANPVARPAVTAQFKVDTLKPALGSLCVLAWSDLNGNGAREAGEPLLPETVLPLHGLDDILRLLGPLFFIVDLFFFLQAKFMAWDAKIWQAEPAAKLLVGGEDVYARLSEEEKQKLNSHVADVSIGINKATWVVSGGKAELKNAPSDTFAKFGGPGILVVQEGHAVVLERRGMISGVVGTRSSVLGSGLHFLKAFERVGMVVYLPTQPEKTTVRGIVTKDKVFIESLELFVFHRIDRGDRSKKSGMYPFDAKVILEKVWSPRGNPEKPTVENEQSRDRERNPNQEEKESAIQSIAARAVRDVVARHDLDEAIVLTGAGKARLITEIRDQINQTTMQFLGVEVVFVDIGRVTVNEQAIGKMWELWTKRMDELIAKISAEITRTTLLSQGEGQALAIAQVERVKNQFRDDIIRQISAPLMAGAAPPMAAKEVAVRFLETIEELAKAIMRDDIGMERYLETLRKFAEGGGDKTILLGTEHWPMTGGNQ